MATTGETTYEEIEASVLHLPQPDRSRLATRLLASLEEDDDFPVSDAWRREINRRVDDIESGRAVLVSHEEATERVQAKIEEVRRRQRQG